MADLSALIQPYIRFLFVGLELCPLLISATASGFLQIPHHDGHPCLRLMLPATERVVDFHHLVIAHAGRTPEEKRRNKIPALFLRVAFVVMIEFVIQHIVVCFAVFFGIMMLGQNQIVGVVRFALIEVLEFLPVFF